MAQEALLVIGQYELRFFKSQSHVDGICLKSNTKKGFSSVFTRVKETRTGFVLEVGNKWIRFIFLFKKLKSANRDTSTRFSTIGRAWDGFSLTKICKSYFFLAFRNIWVRIYHYSKDFQVLETHQHNFSIDGKMQMVYFRKRKRVNWIIFFSGVRGTWMGLSKAGGKSA